MTSNLSLAFAARFGRTGDQADLDAAITVGRQAVTVSPVGVADEDDRTTGSLGQE